MSADSGNALLFPKGFLWGAATSSHQIEGCNDNNDWWRWEQMGKTAEPSLQACDSFRRYEEDFDLAKALYHNAHRFSIEWSRVQPKENEWDPDAIEHYRNVIRALKARNMEPVVTLHHFTNPIWFADKGGWENPKSVSWFTAYCDRLVEALGLDIRYWITINEPNVYAFHSYAIDMWPPGASSVLSMMKVYAHMAAAHCRVYARIHRFAEKRGLKDVRVGLAHAVPVFEPRCPESFRDRLAVFIRDRANNHLVLKLVWHSRFYLPAVFFGTGGRKRCMDFIGLNYYFREIIKSVNPLGGALNIAGDVCRDDERYLGSSKSSLGWEVYPEGIYAAIMSLSRYGLPVMITENGICTDDDKLRESFIVDHLRQVHRAIQSGASVIGYQYWSLVDNFEWSFGFKPRFGLVHVNHQTQERSIRMSAKRYADICRQNALSPAS